MSQQSSLKSFFKPKAKKQKTNDGGESSEVLEKQKTSSACAEPAAAVTQTDDEADERKRKIAKSKREAETKRTLAFLKPIVDDEWRQALEGEAKKPYLFKLMDFVGKERKTKAVFPPADLTFAALDACPLSDIKVVIVGQDPYHGPGQAHGLAFSIKDGSKCRFPPSLRNILKECAEDVGASMPPQGEGDLTAWATRGVLLLNTCLTVRRGEANSHKDRGWETFTDAIIRAVNKRSSDKGVVFVLWGKPALTKCANIDKKKHKVIVSSHPSPLSNTKTDKPFTGSKCFSRINAHLTDDLGWDAGVDWNL